MLFGLGFVPASFLMVNNWHSRFLSKQQKRAWTTRPDLVDYLANLADKRDLSRAALFL